MVVKKLKEQCKAAARLRREKERTEFLELSKLLPLPSSITSQLDKASIIRLTSSYLRIRSAFPSGLGTNWGEKFGGPNYQLQQMQQVRELGSLILQTLDGFVFAMHADGKIMYISETASVHLGLPQIDLTGSSIFEFVNPADHNDVCEALNLSDADRKQLPPVESLTGSVELGRSFCMRMKCILPKRNAGLVTNGYKAIYCNGYLKVRAKLKQVEAVSPNNEQQEQRQQQHMSINNEDADRTPVTLRSQNQISSQDSCDWEPCALVAVGHSLLPSGTTEIKLTGSAFMFRANLDLKLYFIESLVSALLGYDQMEMVGLSLYQFIHVDDTSSVEQSHRNLLSKSQVVTKYFRFMRKDGGCVWVQSYASLVNNPRSMPRPQHVVGYCQIIGADSGDKSLVIQDQVNRILEQKTRETSGHPMITPETRFSDTNLTSDPMKEKSRDPKITTVKMTHKFDRRQANKSQKTRRPRPSSRVAETKDVFAPLITRSSEKLSLAYQKRHQQHEQTLYFTSEYTKPITTTADQYQTPVATCTMLPCEPMTVAPAIGSIRRASDDSCSIVSSIASTSLSSVSSGNNSFVDSLQMPEYSSSYMPMNVCHHHHQSGPYLHDSTPQYQGNCQPAQPIDFEYQQGAQVVSSSNNEYQPEQIWPAQAKNVSISRAQSLDSTSTEGASYYVAGGDFNWSQHPEVEYQQSARSDCRNLKTNTYYYQTADQSGGYPNYTSYADLATSEQHSHYQQMVAPIEGSQTVTTVQ